MKKRTRKQKIRSAEKRKSGVMPVQYHYDVPSPRAKAASVTVSSSSLPVSFNQKPLKKTIMGRDLFAYDVKLIYQDLRKTLVVVTLLFLILFGIFFYLSGTLPFQS